MRSVRGIQTCQHRARSRWGGVFRRARIRSRPADGTAARIGVRVHSANTGNCGARYRQTDGPGVCTASVFRHACVRRRARGTAAGIGIRQVHASASTPAAVHGRADRRRVLLPSVRRHSSVCGADGTAARLGARLDSARADRRGAGKGQADTSVPAASARGTTGACRAASAAASANRAPGAAASPSVWIRPTDGSAAGLGIRLGPA